MIERMPLYEPGRASKAKCKAQLTIRQTYLRMSGVGVAKSLNYWQSRFSYSSYSIFVSVSTRYAVGILTARTPNYRLLMLTLDISNLKVSQPWSH